ncbi:MAG TPA: alpha/beta hydrolase fold domain-containing protein, partial [Ramlibacter sp.]|nr:alpha/beta hydrolase fold domain-containing protein [Ramlibacter sp.]
MRSVLERMARAGYPPIYTLTAREAKAAYEAAAGVLEMPQAQLARVEDFSIPARDGYPLPARLYAPSRDSLAVLLFFHGGGFTIGSIASHDVLCREFSRLSGCAVVSLDYRLAPEHRFPTAVNDAWDATQWLAANGRGLG